jgi:hypothetical protein
LFGFQGWEAYSTAQVKVFNLIFWGKIARNICAPNPFGVRNEFHSHEAKAA